MAPLHNFIVLSVVFTTRWKKTETNRHREGGVAGEEEGRDRPVYYAPRGIDAPGEDKRGGWLRVGRVFMQRRHVSAQPSGMIDIWPLSANFSVSVASRKNNFIVKAEVEAYLFVPRRG